MPPDLPAPASCQQGSFSPPACKVISLAYTELTENIIEDFFVDMLAFEVCQ